MANTDKEHRRRANASVRIVKSASQSAPTSAQQPQQQQTQTPADVQQHSPLYSHHNIPASLKSIHNHQQQTSTSVKTSSAQSNAHSYVNSGGSSNQPFILNAKLPMTQQTAVIPIQATMPPALIAVPPSVIAQNQALDHLRAFQQHQLQLQQQGLAQTPDILCMAVRKMGYYANPPFEMIGEGAFSRVYRIKSTKITNKDVAVKIVRVDDPNISQAWKEHSMRRELKILKKVKHPNVITVYDVVKTRTRIYIFMDLAATSVSSHLEATEEPASEQTARRWFGGISNAVAYLHQTEIAHRDLKNDNILIDSNGIAKLTDFGFACFTYDKLTRNEILSKTSCGTKAYVAPEVFNPPYSPKYADVWSLGVCLFECVTLQQPFNDELPTQTFIRRQLEKKFSIPDNFKSILSDWLVDLMRKMLEPDTNKRIRSEAVLIHPWIRAPRV